MKSEASSFNSAIARESLHQHLHMYALAASAAGVTMLALAQPGEAEIIYTPANVMIGQNQHYNLDLNGDGITDFTIKNHSAWFSSIFGSGSLFARSPAGNQVAAHLAFGGYPQRGVHHFAYALTSGIPISKQARHFSAGRASMTWWCACDAGSFFQGSWVSHRSGGGLGTRYLGLKFKIDGEVHYGWARLDCWLLTCYAYETIPNQGLYAGQEQENEKVQQSDSAAVTHPAQTPATLGALARGSRGLATWRRRRTPGAN